MIRIFIGRGKRGSRKKIVLSKKKRVLSIGMLTKISEYVLGIKT